MILAVIRNIFLAWDPPDLVVATDGDLKEWDFWQIIAGIDRQSGSESHADSSRQSMIPRHC